MSIQSAAEFHCNAVTVSFGTMGPSPRTSMVSPSMTRTISTPGGVVVGGFVAGYAGASRGSDGG